MAPDSEHSPAGPTPADAGRRATYGVVAAAILEILAELNGIEDTEVLLDRLAEHAARISGFGTALLSLALPEGALVGSFNLPAEDRARFKRRALKTNIEYRMEKRRKIREFAYPGTGICFVPHVANLTHAPLSEDYRSRERAAGSWHPQDNLFILVTGSRGREIGVLSLDFPLDGNVPDSSDLGPLRLAEQLLAVGGSLLQTRLLEQSLRRGEEEMRAVFENAPVGIYRRLADGQILSANHRLAAIFGYATPEEMVADDGALARLEPPEVAQAIERLEAGGEVATREVNTTRRDGRPLRVRLTVRRLPAREYTLGIVEDVTDASQLEDHLERARRLEAVGTLVSGVAHDFNNILCGILGYATLLREDSALDKRSATAARSIEEAAERGADLTRRLLGLTRGSPAEEAALDVGEVLADCARIARETFDRRIEIALTVAPGLPRVRGRASDLHQAVMNLCINARDAMPRGGRIRLAASEDRTGPRQPPEMGRPETWVRIDVADDGEGIDEATRARLFEPFFTTKQRGKGTGLGLYMVYTSIKAHGGAVDVESVRGQGTRFTLFLPAGTATPEARPTALIPTAAIPHAPAGARILLVEDEPMLRDLASAVLVQAGHSVDPAADGETAAAKIEAHGAGWDVVVLDLVLPRLSGVEVYRCLRARFPKVPVLLCSGNIEEGLLDQEVRSGVSGLLPKPYRTAELLSAVDRLLAAKR